MILVIILVCAFLVLIVLFLNTKPKHKPKKKPKGENKRKINDINEITLTDLIIDEKNKKDWFWCLFNHISNLTSLIYIW